MISTKSNNGSPSCWICLCDEPDDTGLLPVRDCSCRGDSAGYAHLSCLVKYAQTKSTEILDNPNSRNLLGVWRTCPNCEQKYQHDLALDLANSLVLFVEKMYPAFNTPIAYLSMIAALQTKIEALFMDSMYRKDFRMEGIKTANRSLALIKELKTNATLVDELPFFEQTIVDREGMAYSQLGSFYTLDRTEASKQKAIYYCQMSHNVYKSNGTLSAQASKTMGTTIKMLKYGHSEEAGIQQGVAPMRELYKKRVRESGMDSTDAIFAATTLARALHLSFHGIEAERLLTKYLPISHRVHGEEHSITKEIEQVLSKGTARLVMLESGGRFQALRYEDEGEKCVVYGPLQKCNYIIPLYGATSYTVDSSSLLICNATPVVCQGLVKGAHLNGKLADVRAFDKDKERYTIHFEDNSLKPVAVKKQNVRIVFDLPDVE